MFHSDPKKEVADSLKQGIDNVFGGCKQDEDEYDDEGNLLRRVSGAKVQPGQEHLLKPAKELLSYVVVNKLVNPLIYKEVDFEVTVGDKTLVRRFVLSKKLAKSASFGSDNYQTLVLGEFDELLHAADTLKSELMDNVNKCIDGTGCSINGPDVAIDKVAHVLVERVKVFMNHQHNQPLHGSPLQGINWNVSEGKDSLIIDCTPKQKVTMSVNLFEPVFTLTKTLKSDLFDTHFEFGAGGTIAHQKIPYNIIKAYAEVIVQRYNECLSSLERVMASTNIQSFEDEESYIRELLTKLEHE